MKTINFAIDLGTTNSLIAKYNESTVVLYNNPVGLKQTLPSCVAFRGNRTIVGDKALDYLEKDAANVCMLFKRKMGSAETFYIPSLAKEYTPIALSAIILKELRNFVIDESIEASVVITIPASFDTIQSNATKKAGYLAGFKEVVLLQEPIAACLAYANMSNLDIQESQKWIVYDFGGGTFDVALVHVDDRELKVIDNAGDNFLGGADFDALIVKGILIPFLEEKTGIPNLWTAIKKKSSAYKGVYFELLKKAEEAKKELSLAESTEIELDLDLDNGEDVQINIYEYITVQRTVFEALIKSRVQQTIDFIKTLVQENQLTPKEIERVILIGGTTYIPYIREQIKEQIGITVDSSINPTSAVVEGAAYYAGSKPVQYTETVVETAEEEQRIECNLFYEQHSRDEEELISGTIQSDRVTAFRIVRKDGGYDSGIKDIAQNSFSEFVPLLERRLNQFRIQLLDSSQNVLETLDTIAINHGNYNVQGQPLPNDICIEVDDMEEGTTRLELLFGKGSILPLQKKIYKTASKSILKGTEERLTINVIEGKSGSLPSSGLSIGFIEVSGETLEEDLIKGTDIEITIEVTESRDVRVNVYLTSCDQEFTNVFTPSERAINLRKIVLEINTTLPEVERLIKEQNGFENYELSEKLEVIRVGLIEAQIEASLLEETDITDAKYQLDDKKRKWIREFDVLVRSKNVLKELDEYDTAKRNAQSWLEDTQDPKFKERYHQILKNDKEVTNSGDALLIKGKTKLLNELSWSIMNTDDSNFVSNFISLKFRGDYLDPAKAEKLIQQGDVALQHKDYKTVRAIVYELWRILPDSEDEVRRKNFKDDSKTGLG